MNNIILRKSFVTLSSLAAIAILNSSVSVNAQTTAPEITIPNNQEISTTDITTKTDNVDINSHEAVERTVISQEVATITANHQETAQIITPIPGTAETNSENLSYQPQTNSENTANNTANNQIAQSDIGIGTTTKGSSSYLGVGYNIGVSGASSDLADGNITVISKIGFSSNLSTRPSAIIGDNTTILVPITYDFAFQNLADPLSEALPIAPYLGIGAAFKTGNKSETAFLVTGGVDFPLSQKITATAAVNAGFFGQTDVGVLFGIGYNFSGF